MARRGVTMRGLPVSSHMTSTSRVIGEKWLHNHELCRHLYCVVLHFIALRLVPFAMPPTVQFYNGFVFYELLDGMSTSDSLRGCLGVCDILSS
jgi:hypothetical protein